MARMIDGRLHAKTLATNGDIFSTWTADDAGPFVRNTAFWGVNMVSEWTCVAPSVSTNGLFGLGVAITPRHILYHKHGGPITDGATLRFVASDNTIVLRTQDESVPLTEPDLIVGLLNEDLPASISFCKVAPDDFSSYLDFTASPPVAFVDQEGKCLVTDIQRIVSTLVFNRTPTDSQRLEFHEATVANDSGKAWFGIINDELVLLGVTRDVTDAQGVVGRNAAINQAIEDVDAEGSVSTGYTVTNPDLDEFLT